MLIFKIGGIRVKGMIASRCMQLEWFSVVDIMEDFACNAIGTCWHSSNIWLLDRGIANRWSLLLGEFVTFVVGIIELIMSLAMGGLARLSV